MINGNSIEPNMQNSAYWNIALTNTIPHRELQQSKKTQLNLHGVSMLRSSMPFAQHSRNINLHAPTSRTAFFEVNSRVVPLSGIQMVQSRMASIPPADPSMIKSKANKSKQIRDSSQHIVYVEDKAFISAKSPASKNRISPKKVIKLSSKQKAKNQEKSLQKSKNSAVYVGQSPTLPIFSSSSPTPQIIRPVSSSQEALLRKINILEKRVTDLHCQKQKVLIDCAEEIKKFMKQVQQRDQTIRKLESDITLANFKLECEQKESKKMGQSLMNLQKIKRDLQCENTNQTSSTTQNFINITLSEQIEKLKLENANLTSQLTQLKQKLKQPKQLKTLTQTHQTTPSQPIPQKFIRTFSSAYQSSQLNLEMSEQIMEIDSEQMQVQQILHKISYLSKENQRLKSQLQQSKIEMEIKDTVATETAKIIQQIKDAVPLAVADNLIIKQLQHKSEDQHQEKLKQSIKRIQDILTQI